jgi:hypothetical protein
MLKKLSIFLILVSICFANHIKWQGDYDKALIQAKKEHKILMVYLIKNNCDKCKKVITNFFTNQPYIDKLNKKVIPVIVNLDTKLSFPREMYWSNEYPTIFFVNSKNEIIIDTFSDEKIFKKLKKYIKKL